MDTELENELENLIQNISLDVFAEPESATDEDVDEQGKIVSHPQSLNPRKAVYLQLPSFLRLRTLQDYLVQGSTLYYVEFDRDEFARLANATSLPEFFPLPFIREVLNVDGGMRTGVERVTKHLEAISGTVLRIVNQFPFPDVNIKAPPLYAALMSFGIEQGRVHATPELKEIAKGINCDITLVSEMFNGMRFTTWKAMLSCYISTIMILMHSPVDVPQSTFVAARDRLLSDVQRIARLMTTYIERFMPACLTYKRLLVAQIDQFRTQQAAVLDDNLMHSTNAHRSYPLLMQIMHQLGNEVAVDGIHKFWDVCIIFMPIFARAFENCIYALVFNRPPVPFSIFASFSRSLSDTTADGIKCVDYSLLFPKNPRYWLIDMSRLEYSNTTLELHFDEWCEHQLLEIHAKADILELDIIGLLPTRCEDNPASNQPLERIWKSEMLRYFKMGHAYYRSAHFLAIWFEFFVHMLLLDGTDQFATFARDMRAEIEKMDE